MDYFLCINGGLIFYIISRIIGIRSEFISILLILIGVILFGDIVSRHIKLELGRMWIIR
jgi:hypothetical protein